MATEPKAEPNLRRAPKPMGAADRAAFDAFCAKWKDATEADDLDLVREVHGDPEFGRLLAEYAREGIEGMAAKFSTPILVRAGLQALLERTSQHDVDIALLSTALRVLRKRVEELEANTLHDEGIFEQGKTYRRGSLVTHKNSAWIARQATFDAPGTTGDWRLASRGK